MSLWSTMVVSIYPAVHGIARPRFTPDSMLSSWFCIQLPPVTLPRIHAEADS
jgi:hypothetical protein